MEPRQVFRLFREKLVLAKFTLSRGYVWLQTPSLIIIGVGVLKPYFPQLRFYQLAIITFTVFYSVGWIDRKLKLVHEEHNLSIRYSPLLMDGLYNNRKE